MRFYAAEAVESATPLKREDFETDPMRSRGFVKTIEIIGEAARKIPDDMRARYAHVPWGKIISMRNQLVHVYFSIDLDRVWTVVQEELPQLIIFMDEIIEAEQRSNENK